jgi:hypothetical protein
MVRLGLWVLPWRRALALADAPRKHSSPRLGVASLERAVRAASRVVPCATCLAQSIALGRLLSREGHPVQIQIGVRRDPGFTAHAWIESDGATLLSTVDQAAAYSPLIGWTVRRP